MILTIGAFAMVLMRTELGVPQAHSQTFIANATVAPGRVEVSSNHGSEQWRRHEDLRSRLSSAFERPLFVEARTAIEDKPAIEVGAVYTTPVQTVVVAAPVQPLKPSTPAVKYIGYMQTGDILEALVSVGADGKEEWIVVGSELQDWRVAEISTSSIQFERLEHVFVVEIER
ncbi:hypothetical protein [uncultured Tateyamaria sp.]|uniref:hypothetical protein n=1 Tax=uncultured Tateyamaria sp. TaxID=455651 RepID=UPI002601D79B|nr:hypothetical protein [uncultured Tateyamaria sp.]